MPELGTNFCSYFCKTLSIIFGIIGIILTVEAGSSCMFISFRDTDGDQLDAIRDEVKEGFVFEGARSGNVGIWKYEITNGDNQQGCIDYPQKFFQIEGYPSISTAQLCALLAPILCGLALAATLVDFCICTFPGSSFVAGLLFIIALGLQCGTFSIVADPVFCFDDEDLECEVGDALYTSVAATVMYFLATCFSCCAPYSDPCHKTFSGDGETTKTRTVTRTQTVTQPVVMQAPAPAPAPVVVVQAPPTSPQQPSNGRKSRRASKEDGRSKYDQHGNRIFY